ncbi:diacylglycerol kinase delta isoform X1 [Physeter macrocephalus]|uniref:Diacylglycerol kinase n=1 Tax=Physeter macrocephalus TaxID=9755 RepID=A0A455APG4_PHYMC|nr:diacylglycerol kinase delta isoform X1 [Physeter catodon]|eukprot:XP_028338550.1 diacylglycerol kinase delta isoform X1 [Physeter catodon]
MAAAAGAPPPGPPQPPPPPPPEESSDSEPEAEPGSPQKLIRKVSTSGQIRQKTVIKEGMLTKQNNSFQRSKRRYFKLRGRTLYYAKTAKSIIFDEVDLTDASVAESSTKNVNNSFTVITPCRKLILCADNRKEMEDWIAALKTVQSREHFEPTQYSMDHFSGMHNWYACSHARPTYCNVCREALSGVTSHGLSCEVCKFKAHKRCAVRATSNCKWTTLASIGKDIIEDEDGIAMPHQWLEGNLPVSAKCTVCDKTCGSVLRLQDWRCLWCKAMVHAACRESLLPKCPLGLCKVSVIPPTALNSVDSDGFWKATCPPSCTSPLLVFVNSKSGDNQGVKFLRRFKQLLNPAQVFDLMNGGPHLGLRLFQKFDTFRILVCGGDGSVGWVLSEIDSLNLHKQCQLGVLPLGTGNDLARVLGWGSACDDDTQLPQILEKLERASTKMLDRWSVMAYETKLPRPASSSTVTEDLSEGSEVQQILFYEDSVAAHLSKILTSDQHSVVISSAKSPFPRSPHRVLCETVKDFVARVGKAYEKTTESSEESEVMAKKCSVLKEKLDSLLKTLDDESQASSSLPTPPPTIAEEAEDGEGAGGSCGSSSTGDRAVGSACPARPQIFRPREQLMLRANSLKKAIRQIIEHTEKAVDEQNAQTQEQEGFILGLSESEEKKDLKSDDRACHGEGHGAAKGRSLRRVSKSPCEKLISKGSLSLGGSASLPSQSGNRDSLPALNTKILFPNVRAGMSGSLPGGSVISRLLINADPFNPEPENLKNCLEAGTQGCSKWPETPLCREYYTEKCVMNNYFGIGLDAKISLDFNNKRDEHPEKCRSRTKNMMWYGVLGTRELLHRTYRNLEQKVLLECDGRPIPLPSLQGIAVLNIPSYAGGTNFWGGTKEDDTFAAPSFDDKILEVVAVFGSMQMAVSRVIKLQHHRIAQCRTVKISILGDEGVPVQVDGEAWIQPPGYIRIIHKNRAQTLTRDRAFENTLKSWEDKQKGGLPRPPSFSLHPEILSEEEANQMDQFGQAAGALIHSIREIAQSQRDVEQELAHAVNASAKSMDRVYGKPRTAEGLSCSFVLEMVNNVRALRSETELLLAGKLALQLDPPQKERLTAALVEMDQQLRKLADTPWLCQPVEPGDEENVMLDLSKRSRSGKFRLVTKFKKEKNNKNREARSSLGAPVHLWGTEEVAAWLEHLSLCEYKDIFTRHDIRGSELLHLERRDLKDLGVTKVGHMKRILCGIKELSRSTPAAEA